MHRLGKVYMSALEMNCAFIDPIEQASISWSGLYWLFRIFSLFLSIELTDTVLNYDKAYYAY